MEPEFDPLDYQTIADTVVAALLDKPTKPLPPPERFPGAGVYILYYNGSFEPYSPVSGSETPIYTGRAIPSGSRRGPAALRQIEQTQATTLYKRLADHAQSIEAATNIELADFRCRYLVVKPIWIRIAEALLIHRFHPVWNALVDGFGLHDPGSTRYGQRKSDWDTLHPGRSWEPKMATGKPVEQVVEEIQNHFKSS